MASELITISPIDGREVVCRPYATESHIRQTLQSAQSAQRSWKETDLAERARLLSAAVDRVVDAKPDFAQAITLQMGRPIRHAPSEIDGFAERARHMIAIAPEALRPLAAVPGSDRERFIRREPLGVTLTVAPWNYPLLTAVNSIVPALMAGNAVVLKHSDQTPLCAELMHQAFARAGLPHGLFSFLHADHATTQKLVRAPEIRFVSFTGSVRGGRAVEESASGRFIGVGLELGGNDAAYVRGDADLEPAVEALVDGAFFNAGQSCCGIQRIYVARRLYDDFVEQAAALTRRYVLGDPRERETSLGPVVRRAAAASVREVIAEAIDRGARNVVDPAYFPAAREDSAYVAPAVLTHVDHAMRVMREECFGPVVGIMPVEDDDEAITLVNDSDYGLTAAIFTRDRAAALDLGGRIQAGTIFMNRCDYLDPGLAWTGVKDSGRGVSLSRLGYEQLTQPKSFHLRVA
ncbi:aldehyde dehydrogenase family protein [Bordetella genomosp. 11]|uniref:Aldehyde dehydrogenase n=1 Tax=Bordetella genomosp. 11 TaxID=1416808 RepID=A0A261UQJ6_9BORD|nr:aldehyde dehydrogenase family protein [Bordetella genomosp. 11]OZI63173.1 aldehyde dehydrogenase [Bordetella genomosp. 11]